MVNHVNVFEEAITGGAFTTIAATPDAISESAKTIRPGTLRRVQKASIPFIRGPIPLHWLTTASALSRSAARLSAALWYRLGLTGQHVDLVTPGEKPLVVRIDQKLRKECDLQRWHVSEGILDLVNAGLIRVVKAGRGRCPEVAVLVQTEGSGFRANAAAVQPNTSAATASGLSARTRQSCRE